MQSTNHIPASISNRKKVLEQKPMNFWERMYIPALIKGLGITIRYFFKPNVSVKYPEETRPYSKNFRGQHSLKGMRKDGSAVQHVVCAPCLARLRLLPWFLRSVKRERSTYTGKRNTRQFMRSICFVVFFVDFVKRLVLKRLFIWMVLT
jgi:hypothetical protein